MLCRSSVSNVNIGDVEKQSDEAKVMRNMSGRELIETTEFFDEAWVLKMSVQFVDICKTMHITTEHQAKFKTLDIFLMMATAGLTGLHILWDKVTFEGLIAIFMLVYFAISNLADPLVANNQLVKVRTLSWECYGELISHSLLSRARRTSMLASRWRTNRSPTTRNTC